MQKKSFKPVQAQIVQCFCPKGEMWWLPMWLLVPYQKAKTIPEVRAPTMPGRGPCPLQSNIMASLPQRAWLSFPHLQSVRVCALNRICRLWVKKKNRAYTKVTSGSGWCSCQLGTQVQLQIMTILKRRGNDAFINRIVFLHVVQLGFSIQERDLEMLKLRRNALTIRRRFTGTVMRVSTQHTSPALSVCWLLQIHRGSPKDFGS